MGDDAKCADCQNNDGPITQDDALGLAYEALENAHSEALAGRAAEASMLNQTASLAISLAEKLELPLLNPIATGIVQ